MWHLCQPGRRLFERSTMDQSVLHPLPVPPEPLDGQARWRRPLGGIGWLNIIALMVAALFAIPVLSVLANLFEPAGATWSHLADTVLPDYVANTLLLVLGVGLGVPLIGTSCAWLVTLCRFPGRRLFEWALVLPLAVPA